MGSPSDDLNSNILANVVEKEMIARLDWMTLQPRVIITIASGTSSPALALQSRYQQALVLSLDCAETMPYTVKRNNATSPHSFCADAAKLPLADGSVDLIFAHFFLPWQKEISSLLSEWCRILHPQGLLMFNAFGPDTLHTYSKDILPERIDMHIFGDLLLEVGLSDPVLDVNYYTMIYSSKEKFVEESFANGMLRSVSMLQDENLTASTDGKWHAQYEIIYAHAFKPSSQVKAQEDGLVRIPLSELRETIKTKNGK